MIGGLAAGRTHLLHQQQVKRPALPLRLRMKRPAAEPIIATRQEPKRQRKEKEEKNESSVSAIACN